MPNREQEPRRHDRPNELPPEIAEFLRDRPRAAMLWGTDQGSVLIIKIPRADIDKARGERTPIHTRHELYGHSLAPVIRMVVRIYDRPGSRTHTALDTFVNVADEQQREHYEALTRQHAMLFLFHDERLTLRLTKIVPYDNQGDIAQVLQMADAHLSQIPQQRFNFDLAKADVMRATNL